MPFGTRTMSSNGSSGSSIQSQIAQQNESVKNKLNQLDLQPETLESLKKDIDYRTNSLLGRLLYKGYGTTTEEKVAALQSLKDNGIEYFILNFDTTNSNSEYAPIVAYIQAIFNGLKTRYPTDEWVISYETPSPLEADRSQQIDSKITELQDASVQAQPAKGFLSSLFGRGGRKQKRTKKGGKKSKRKTKRHKKTRSRRR